MVFFENWTLGLLDFVQIWWNTGICFFPSGPAMLSCCYRAMKTLLNNGVSMEFENLALEKYPNDL